jgi:predicted metalloprotease
MLWRGREGSGNVEDRRGMSGGGLAVGGGIGGLIIYLLYSFLGGNPNNAPVPLPGQQTSQEGKRYDPRENAADDTLAQFTSVVLRDTEDVWGQLLSNYKKPRLVLFSDAVQSACGSASAAVGPFYCPGDEKVYIDLSFSRS